MKKIAIFLFSSICISTIFYAMQDEDANKQPLDKKTILGCVFSREKTEKLSEDDKLMIRITEHGAKEIITNKSDSKDEQVPATVTDEKLDDAAIDVTCFFDEEYFK